MDRHIKLECSYRDFSLNMIMSTCQGNHVRPVQNGITRIEQSLPHKIALGIFIDIQDAVDNATEKYGFNDRWIKNIVVEHRELVLALILGSSLVVDKLLNRMNSE